MDRLSAYIILNLLPNIGPVKVRKLIDYFGSPEAIFKASFNDIIKVYSIGNNIAEIISNWRNYCDFEGELQAAELANINIICCEDDNYPPLLKNIYDPPLVLYVKGNLDVLRKSSHSIAIVGSRFTTHYGMTNAHNFSKDAAIRGWTTISGLARGIDTCVHEATYRNKGTTIAVIGSGLSDIYPKENLRIAQEIIDNGGAVISEFPLRTPPSKQSFPMRNRIVSGISAGTLVVEAGFNSGTLITANYANEQGRSIFTIPGRIDSSQSHGCHQLIKSGVASLVESFDDIINELSVLPGINNIIKENHSILEKEPNIVHINNLSLTELEEQILRRAYVDREVAIDVIIGATGAPAGLVLSSLVSLEMKKLIKQIPGKKIIITTDLEFNA